jgi:hypothetical protein
MTFYIWLIPVQIRQEGEGAYDAFSTKINVRCGILGLHPPLITLALPIHYKTHQHLMVVGPQQKNKSRWFRLYQRHHDHFGTSARIFASRKFRTQHIIIAPWNQWYIILWLKGIIYHGNFHFISHIITNDGKIWLHDGMKTGRNAVMEGKMRNITSSYLIRCNSKFVALAIYAQN